MVFSAAGSMVNEVWEEMATEFPEVTLDAHVVMPNHVHAILFLGSDDVVGNPPLGTIVQRFKAITTSRYADGVHREGWAPFHGRM
jgi:REP element-mobilizing transposase RayT